MFTERDWILRMAKVEMDPLRREARRRHALSVVDEVRARAPKRADATAQGERLERSLL